MSQFKLLDRTAADLHLSAMLTRKHIELGAKFFIVTHFIVFTIYTVEVLQMMGFFGGK